MGQSTMSQPTLIRTPASAARGIGSTNRPRPSTRASRSRARNAPDTGVDPPDRMLMTVPMVAPAPGSAPIRPAATLPIPWPISSRSGLWRLPVIESATREVNRLSTEPSRARMIAGCNACRRNSADGRANCRAGRPIGIAPITGASSNQRIPRNVPAASATSGLGAKRENRRGQRNPTASVIAPTARALTWTLPAAAGSARAASIGPLVAPEAPRSGSDCISMMMKPMPDMNPETTTCGV